MEGDLIPCHKKEPGSLALLSMFSCSRESFEYRLCPAVLDRPPRRIYTYETER